ncbi:MAG: carboxypeptidase-like regulatory domain-containing protein [Patescibacteria group bacterium]
MRKIVSLIFVAFITFSSLIANAAVMSGVVVNANTNLPVPWAYVQLHRYNPETGYLEFVMNGTTAEDGSFFFNAEKEGNYLLEVSADSYLLSRVYTRLAPK